MSTTEKPPDELILPLGWKTTKAGLSKDGLHALDTAAGLRRDGVIVLSGTPIPPPDENDLWTGSYVEWVEHQTLHDMNWDTPQGALLRDLLVELEAILQPRQFDLATEWRRYLAEQGHRPPMRGEINGGDFVLDIATDVPAVWGEGQKVLHAEGEPFLICGPQGVGKTTLLGQYALARIGLRAPELLGLPVRTDDRPVIYLALDRPRQIAKSFRRMVEKKDRDRLNETLRFWAGPLPFDLTKEMPRHMYEWLIETFGEFSTVIVDSYKDVIPSLSDEASGAKLNAAMQVVVAEGSEWVGSHHQREAQTGNTAPKTLNDVYGSVWITAGTGSVLCLWGEPGSALVTGVHLKQPAEPIGPLTVFHDHAHGQSTVAEIGETNKHRHALIMATFLRHGGPGVGLKLSDFDLAELNCKERTLQADLKALIDEGRVAVRGATNNRTWCMVAPLA